MRLMTKDLSEITLFRTRRVRSEYVGTRIEKNPVRKFSACRQNVSDDLSIQIYGERAKNMIKLTVKKGEQVISDGD